MIDNPNSFITLNRKILNWRWYRDANTMRVFIHLLLGANIADEDFEKITIHRGQMVTSIQHMASDLNLSPKNVRTALSHLKATGEVASTTYSKFSVITVINYDAYQSKGKQDGSQVASKWQAGGNNITRNNKNNNTIESIERTPQKYGRYKNVILTDEQMEKLKAEFPDWQQRIERLSEYMASKGTKYKDHLATIRSWARKDKQTQTTEPSFNISALEKQMMCSDEVI